MGWDGMVFVDCDVDTCGRILYRVMIGDGRVDR